MDSGVLGFAFRNESGVRRDDQSENLDLDSFCFN